MSMQVDWSKAPTEATHWDCRQFGSPAFMKKLNGADNWQFYSGGEWHIYGRLSSAEESKLIPRPQQWTGKVLPPAGTVCEFIKHNSPPAPEGQWETGKILYVSDCTIVIGVGGGERVHHPRNCSYRPIRTPEQIAKAARSKACDAMYGIMSSPPVRDGNRSDMAEALYDAGYRLFEITEE